MIKQCKPKKELTYESVQWTGNNIEEISEWLREKDFSARFSVKLISEKPYRSGNSIVKTKSSKLLSLYVDSGVLNIEENAIIVWRSDDILTRVSMNEFQNDYEVIS